jgi:hypothetical protein
MTIDTNQAMARATALVEAVKLHSLPNVKPLVDADSGQPDVFGSVLAVAHDFYAFILGNYIREDELIPGRAPAAPTAPVAPVAKPVAAAKPAKAKPAPAPKPVEEPEADEAPATDTTKEQVGEIISKLLSAKLREEAIGLLKDFKATSVSGVKPADYEKFVAAGKVLLGQAALAAQGEVEADIED